MSSSYNFEQKAQPDQLTTQSAISATFGQLTHSVILGALGKSPPAEDGLSYLLDRGEEEDYHKSMTNLDEVVSLLCQITADGKANANIRGDWMEGVMIQTAKRKLRVIIDD